MLGRAALKTSANSLPHSRYKQPLISLLYHTNLVNLTFEHFIFTELKNDVVSSVWHCRIEE